MATPITIATEPIGSIPRPLELIERIARFGSEDPGVESLYEDAIRDTIERFEATGSPVVTDGEQKKYHNFANNCVYGLPNAAPVGFKVSFADDTLAAWPGSHAVLSATAGTQTLTWMSPSATRTYQSNRR